MNPPRPLNRDQLMAALRRLGEQLADRGIDGHIYVVGGAAIAFAYHTDRVTRDIDAVVAPRDELFAAARDITAELELPEDWINDTASAFLPEVSIDDGPVVLEVPGLTVRTAPAEVVLAMKILSSRPAQDAPDVVLLASLLGLRTGAAVREVFRRYYPQGELLDHSLLLIESLFPD